MNQLQKMGNDFLNLVFAPVDESERQDFGVWGLIVAIAPWVFMLVLFPIYLIFFR